METITSIYSKISKQIFSNRRLLVVVAVISGVFAALSFFSKSFLQYFYMFMRMDLAETSIPITFLLISLASFAILYLQSGSSGTNKDQVDKKIVEKLSRVAEINSHKISELSKEILSLQNLHDELKRESLSENERENLIQRIVKEHGEDSIKRIFDGRVAELKENIEKESIFERILKASEDIVSRLKREISDLRLELLSNVVFEESGGVPHFLLPIDEFYTFNDLS